MQDVDIDTRIERLAACGPLKAWSVIVTVLGDLCAARTERISGRVLNLLIGRMGISAQASRVAIHRLKRDGWIDNEKRGRESLYGLTLMGWTETQRVSPRIYNVQVAVERNLALAIAPPTMAAGDFHRVLPDRAIILAPRVAICQGDDIGIDQSLLVSNLCRGSMPDWVQTSVIDDTLQQGYVALADGIAHDRKLTPPTDIWDRAVLRLLTLHHWRRLRLRHDELADAMMPSDWIGWVARDAVMPVLTSLARPAIQELEDALRQSAS